MSREVLCVDDDEASRYLLGRALDLAGFVVTTAGGAHEGLELLKRRRFDLVISDYQMPDGTGTWMLKRPLPPACRAAAFHGAPV